MNVGESSTVLLNAKTTKSRRERIEETPKDNEDDEGGDKEDEPKQTLNFFGSYI